MSRSSLFTIVLGLGVVDHRADYPRASGGDDNQQNGQRGDRRFDTIGGPHERTAAEKPKDGPRHGPDREILHNNLTSGYLRHLTQRRDTGIPLVVGRLIGSVPRAVRHRLSTELPGVEQSPTQRIPISSSSPRPMSISAANVSLSVHPIRLRSTEIVTRQWRQFVRG
jgi:hypothetical protein